MAESRNLIAKVGLALVAAFFLMCWVVIGGSGSMTGSPTEVFGIPGTLLMFAAIIATFITICIAARLAYQAGNWLWLFSVIFFWPASYIYVLMVNRDE
jgi:hypothetical protein